MKWLKKKKKWKERKNIIKGNENGDEISALSWDKIVKGV